MADIPEIKQGSHLGGIVSAGGFNAQVVDLGADGCPEHGIEFVGTAAVGAGKLVGPQNLEVLIRLTVPKGGMLLLVDPETARHLRPARRPLDRNRLE